MRNKESILEECSELTLEGRLRILTEVLIDIRDILRVSQINNESKGK